MNIQTEHQLQIIKLLKETPHQFQSSAQLAERLGLDRSTIKRNIAAINKHAREYRQRQQDIIHASNLGYKLVELDYELESRFLSAFDLNILAALSQSADFFGTTPIKPVIDDLLRNLFGSDMAINPDDPLSEMRICVSPEASRTIIPDIWNCSVSAARNSAVCKLAYETPAAANSKTRLIQVLQLRYWRGEWYLLAEDQSIMELRIFALSRVKSLEIVELSPLIDGNTAKHQRQLLESVDMELGMYCGSGQACSIVLRFSPDVAYSVTARTWHKDQTIRTDAEGHVILSFQTSQLELLRTWILGWGSKVEVVSPPALRQMIVESLQESLLVYGSTNKKCLSVPDFIRRYTG